MQIDIFSLISSNHQFFIWFQNIFMKIFVPFDEPSYKDNIHLFPFYYFKCMNVDDMAGIWKSTRFTKIISKIKNDIKYFRETTVQDHFR